MKFLQLLSDKETRTGLEFVVAITTAIIFMVLSVANFQIGDVLSGFKYMTCCAINGIAVVLILVKTK